MQPAYYETVFLLNPMLSEEEIRQVVGKYIKFLKDQQADIAYISQTLHRKLARPIRRHSHALYQIIEFRGNNIISKLELMYKRDRENILSFLTCRLCEKDLSHHQAYREKPAIAIS